MSKPSFSARRRTFIASVAIGALAVAFAPPAEAFVAAVAAAASLASSLLSAGGKGSDLTFTAIMADMKMVEALHERMNEVDANLAFIMTQLNHLKKDFRDELNHDRDINRSESVSGDTVTMVGLLTDLAAAEKHRNKKEIASKKEQLKWFLTLVMAKDRNALMKRTDFVLPTLIASMVTEIRTLKIRQVPQEELHRVLGEYDDRLAMAQDPSREGSLVYMRHELEAQQAILAHEIAVMTEGKDAKELVAGTFPWLIHSKVHNEERLTSVNCIEPNAIKFDGNERAMPIPVAPERPHLQRLSIVPGCIKRDTVLVQEHSRRLQRIVSLAPLTGSIAAGLFTVTITYATPVQTNTVPGSENHFNSDEDYEKQHLESDQALQRKVKEFNDRAVAILNLEQLENIVSTARGLILRWDDAAAGKVVAFPDWGAKSSDAVDLVEDDRRDAAVSDRIAATKTVRREAWRKVEEARREVSQAIERARREKWRSDVIAGLAILRASLQTYVAVDREYFSTQDKAQTDGAARAAPVIKGATRIVDATASAGNHHRASAGAATRQQSAHGGTASIAERAPGHFDDDAARMNRVMQIIEEVKHKKLDYSSKLPNELTHEELLLLEGMEHLNKIGETAGDRFAREEQVTPGAVARDIVTGAASGGPHEAAREALKDVITPTITADDTLLGEQQRNAVRKELNDLYRPYFVRRFVDSAAAGVDYSHIDEDVCMSKDGCVGPARP
jgi:hypothetical protein